MAAVPVLTYHAARIDGNDYSSNDHVAFCEDLRIITALNFRIISLRHIADRIIAGEPLPERSVAISFDDGTDFDFADLPHPSRGPQRSIFNILQDFIRVFGKGRQPDINVTSFVIASPVAREEIDRLSLINLGWMSDTWWETASQSGLMDIGNHSWDHNHPQTSGEMPPDERGNFRTIDNRKRADHQFRRAYEYIREMTAGADGDLFAYPYGEYNDFLVREYLPLGEAVTGTRAAFTTQAMHATSQSCRWQIPRYTFGVDWHTPEELIRILSQ